MVLGAIIAIVTMAAGIGSGFAKPRGKVIDIIGEPGEDIPEVEGEPIFEPIPEEELPELAEAGEEALQEAIRIGAGVFPVEEKIEISQEQVLAGALLPLSVVEEAEPEEILAGETFLTSGELAVAERTAQLLDISIEEAVEIIEEQKIAVGFIVPEAEEKFHVGETAIINSGSLQGEEFRILSIVDSSVTGTTPKRSGVRTIRISRLDKA